MSGWSPAFSSLLTVKEAEKSKPLSSSPDTPSENLSASSDLGAGGESKADPRALPINITANGKGLPPLPGKTAFAGVAKDNAGYDGDWKLSLTSIDDVK